MAGFEPWFSALLTLPQPLPIILGRYMFGTSIDAEIDPNLKLQRKITLLHFFKDLNLFAYSSKKSDKSF